MSYPKSDFSEYSVGACQPKRSRPAGALSLPETMAGRCCPHAGHVARPVHRWRDRLRVAAPRDDEAIRRNRLLELARLSSWTPNRFNSETSFMSRAIKFIRSNHPTVEALYRMRTHRRATQERSTGRQTGNDGRTDQEHEYSTVRLRDGAKTYSRRSHVPDGEVIHPPRLKIPLCLSDERTGGVKVVEYSDSLCLRFSRCGWIGGPHPTALCLLRARIHRGRPAGNDQTPGRGIRARDLRQNNSGRLQLKYDLG